MQYYSITEAARRLEVQRHTLYKWIREKQVPAPNRQVIAGSREKFWTEQDMAALEEYKDKYYWGKGKSRGKRKKKNKKVKK
jgi:transposase-like protein